MARFYIQFSRDLDAQPSRDHRQYETSAPSGWTSGDGRNPFQRDRDRILYSSAFRRLAGITEVVRAGESDVFHTRQQHTLKVAQVGRRLAERLNALQSAEALKYGVDPDVVEAACLAHDLGHPPFGHAGEEELCALVEANGDDEGYEGNAQTFRIITKLAARAALFPGLNLTAATLAATLKYPWERDLDDTKRSKKWSVYRTERKTFEFSQKHLPFKRKTAEAEIMDWADDIAYSVHDIEDFHRCQFIPWQTVWSDTGKAMLITGAINSWFEPPANATERLEAAYDDLKEIMIEYFNGAYEGTLKQRYGLRTINSTLITNLMAGISLVDLETYKDESNGRTVILGDEEGDTMRLLKQITRSFIISSPNLAAQQKGQKRIIRELFQDLYDDSHKGHAPKYLPARLCVYWESDVGKEASRARRVADCISSLTEAETVAVHARLRGISGGSVLDPIVR